jgi:hypothetical protein
MSQEPEPNENLENGLETFIWKGQKRYRCPWQYDAGGTCAYDSYDVRLLMEHVRDTHGKSSVPENAGRVSSLVDQHGQHFVVPAPAPEVRGAKFKKEE